MDVGDLAPGAVGEPVDFAMGDGGWVTTFTDSDLGGCVVVIDGADGRSVGCGFEVPERHHIGSVVLGSERGDIIAGPVSEETTRVEVVLTDSATVEALPVSQPGLPSPHYAVQVPARAEVAEVVAFDEAGQELERRSATRQ